MSVSGGQPPYDEPTYGEPRFAETPPPNGHPTPAPAPYGQAPLYGQPAYAADYATWLQRVGAYVIDGIVTGLPAFVFFVAGVAVGGSAGVVLILLGYAAGFAVFLANTVFRQGRTGQSIGKEQVSIRLVRELDGQPVGPGLSFVRQLAHVLDSLPFDLGFLWPLWDRKRQTFADKVCGTVVVRSPR